MMVLIILVVNANDMHNVYDIAPNTWLIRDIGKYDDIDTLTIILNGKISGEYDFTQYRDEFKKVSYK